jgi:hypothetical protein
MFLQNVKSIRAVPVVSPLLIYTRRYLGRISAIDRDALLEVYNGVEFRKVDERITKAKQGIVDLSKVMGKFKKVVSTTNSPDFASKCHNSSVIWEYLKEELPNSNPNGLGKQVWVNIITAVAAKHTASASGSTEAEYKQWRARLSGLSEMAARCGEDSAMWLKGTRSGLGEAPSNKKALESGYSQDDLPAVAEQKIKYKALMSSVAREMSSPKYLRETSPEQVKADRAVVADIIVSNVDMKVLISLLSIEDLPVTRFQSQITAFKLEKSLKAKLVLSNCLTTWKKELVAEYYQDTVAFNFLVRTGKTF